MAEIFTYQCPCCGGAISFDSTVQKMVCPYCDTAFEMETLRQYDEELKKDAPSNMPWETQSDKTFDGAQDGVFVYSCSTCGGQIIGDETMAATKCPYCDNPVIVMGQLSGDLKPDYVIPFTMDKNDAKAAFQKHLKRKLLPKVFKDQNHIDEIKGVYVPFWLFGGNADAKIRYKAERTRSWSDSSYIYTQHNFFSVTREGTLGFSHVPVDGSSKMEDKLMESIEPYDFSKAVDFQTAYLAGYLADRYDVDAQACQPRANQRIGESTQQAFRQTIQGFSSVVQTGAQINLIHGVIQYALYPVWIMNTTWKGKQYRFAMNGQTGKFVGNLPVDIGAAIRWFLGIWGSVSVVVALIKILFDLF